MNRTKLAVFGMAILAAFCGALVAGAAETASGVTVDPAPQAVLPVEGLEFTQPLAFQNDSLPTDPREPIEPLPANVWCCKPDGNCAKIKATKCANIGGVQHTTEAACLNDPNC
ncbi:MAG: hypothetical protein KDD47_14270 [Acidobacteria bacterium]|nr:hypothetical protein [Acidobacteriota bacterium]